MSFFDRWEYSRFPSIPGCLLLMITFSFYTYRNIFLQSEVGYKLPPLNLVSALNNFDIFAATPSTERFDLYVNLAKTFEAYKEDYMEHYNDYLLMLNSYLVLDESQIALKYYAYKYYLNETYMENDNFVLGSPIVEFNENFLSPTELSTDKELNLVNKDYHLFGVKDNKKDCEAFFNNYIYPLYKSQSNWGEVEIAKQMSTIINHWSLLKRLQISSFFCSLALITITLIIFPLTKMKPSLLYKQLTGYCFIALFAIIYLSLIALSITSFSLSVATYKTNINFQGLHNTSFNVIQILILITVGYLVLGWVSGFLSQNNPENLNESHAQENESLQQYLATLMKIPANTTDEKSAHILGNTKERITSGATYILQNGIASVEPVISAFKRLVSSKEANATDIEKNVTQHVNKSGLSEVVEEKSVNYNNDNNIKEEINVLRNASISSEKLFSKDIFENMKALNMVSALSFNHPDVSPYTHLDKNSQYSSIQQSRISSDNKLLKDEKYGFYNHTDAAISNLGKPNDNVSMYSDQVSIHDSAQKFYMSSAIRPLLMRTPLPVPAPTLSPLRYSVPEDDEENNADSQEDSTSIQWDKKFGMSSSPSHNSSKKNGLIEVPEYRRVSTVKAQPNSSTTLEVKRSNSEKIKTRKVSTKKPSERKGSKFQYFLPSTQQSEFTETSAEIISDGETSGMRSADEKTKEIMSSDHSESMFSVERVVREHRKSM